MASALALCPPPVSDINTSILFVFSPLALPEDKTGGLYENHEVPRIEQPSAASNLRAYAGAVVASVQAVSLVRLAKTCRILSQ